MFDHRSETLRLKEMLSKAEARSEAMREAAVRIKDHCRKTEDKISRENADLCRQLAQAELERDIAKEQWRLAHEADSFH